MSARTGTVELRERVRDFIYDCTKDEAGHGWTLSAEQADHVIALSRPQPTPATGEIVELREKVESAVKNQTGGKLNRAQTVTLSVYSARKIIDAFEQQAATIAELRERLTETRAAIASLPEDALGMGSQVVDFYDGREEPYPLRDELLSNIDATLNKTVTP